MKIKIKSTFAPIGPGLDWSQVMRLLLFIAFALLQFPTVAESPSLPKFRSIPQFTGGTEGPWSFGATLTELRKADDAVETVEPEAPRLEPFTTSRSWSRPLLESIRLSITLREFHIPFLIALVGLPPRAPPFSQT